MKLKTCCFTGHRKLLSKDIPKIKKHLENEITALVQQGVIYLGCGGALGFDTLAAKTVIKLRNTYPQIKLILVLPCTDQTRCWPQKNKTEYKNIIYNADKVRILSEHYYNGCMQASNRFLVDNSSICVCYLRQEHGGTAYTVKYAEKNGKTIINLGA